MVYLNYGRKNYGNKGYGKRNYSRKKSKYSKSEQVAFRLGQEARIRASLNANKPSRVQDAFEKGFNGIPHADQKKPLFAE